MSIEVFYSQIDTPEIDREIVEAETDVSTLQEWHTALRTIEGELATMIASLKLADAGGLASMARKLGYVRIASNWTKRRLEQIGGDIPDGEMSGKFKRMKALNTQANQALEARNKKIKALQARVAELEAALKAAKIDMVTP